MKVAIGARHIEQTKLPRGIYWQKQGEGRWYVFVPHPQGGPATAKTWPGRERDSPICTRSWSSSPARTRSTIGYVCARFEESTEFAEQSAAIRKDYKYCAQVARNFKTDKGKAPRSTSSTSIG